MTATSLFGFLRGYVRAIATNRPLALHACDRVGPDVKLHGRPAVTNDGFIEVGGGTIIWSRPVPAQLATGRDGSLHIGPNVSIGYGCSIAVEALVTIGEGARIGPFGNVFDTEDDPVSGWGRSSRPVVIGRNARIGSKVTILPGTSIGDGAEIDAGSVVSGVVPPGAKASGVPARVAGPSAPSTSPDVSARVQDVVARVFNRTAPPAPSLELERLSGWGGEGALRLLVAIEDEFGLALPEDEWLKVRTPADLVALIERSGLSGSGRPTPSNGSSSTVS